MFKNCCVPTDRMKMALKIYRFSNNEVDFVVLLAPPKSKNLISTT